MSDLSLKPGLSMGSYPERREPALDELEQAFGRWLARRRGGLKQLRQRTIAQAVGRYDGVLRDCSEAALNAMLRELRARLGRHGLQQAFAIEAFAVIREAAARTLGKRHFDSQLFGGWVMLGGRLAEMQTGEGKTLTTTLPACTAALAGVPVHVITANDYLAERDCELLRPLYARLGLTASAVVDGMASDDRRVAYRADIVHTTNKQVAFDYLRDRIVMGDDTGDLRRQYRQIQQRRNFDEHEALLLRGLCFAIVDEADSVLVDEANTPLIITRTLPDAEPAETYGDALYLAAGLEAQRDYRVDARSRVVELTAAGEDRLEDQVLKLPRLWRNRRKRESLVRQALAAMHLYQRDREYLVADDRVQIIDQATGRLMPDRSWEQGLQQMIEAKEGCVISEPREPQARISYQRFFSRYLRIGGTSGTLGEIAPELKRVYGLDVVRVATHRPSRRKFLGERVYRDQSDQQRALIARVEALYREGRPVLIGTTSVESSERTGAWLAQKRIEHRVLNARQDRDEAAIVAAAGQRGAVTVATNMAGRGTDIALADGVAELGGLHVIALDVNPSQRVDRQLYGRAGRQGDPGSGEAILSLNDESLAQACPPISRRLLAGLAHRGKPLPRLLGRALLRFAQRRFEARQARIRKALMKQDQRLRRTLAFSGRFE